MRLWPLILIPKLPRPQLLGQHRECCALRGNGWGRKHSTVDYVFRHPYFWLFKYHLAVMSEMARRGFKVNSKWMEYDYRGLNKGYDKSYFTEPAAILDYSLIYPEHDERYMLECLENLKHKGIVIYVTRKVA